jgi:hypothetical protein
VKELVFRTAKRLRVATVLVANQRLLPPPGNALAPLSARSSLASSERSEQLASLDAAGSCPDALLKGCQ